MTRFDLPAQVAARAKSMGAKGEKWLAQLDETIGELEGMWKICVEGTLFGGSHAFVGAAVGENGERFALKVDLPDGDETEFLRAVYALKTAGGEGYARLFAYDLPRRALLMERLGETMRKTDIPPRKQMEIICGALQRTWHMPAEEPILPDGDASIEWFRGFIPQAWRENGCPCPIQVIEKAAEYLDARQRAMDRTKWVLLHGDAHNNNMLSVPGSAGDFKLVDPEGIFYEREYDLGVLMREWPEEYENDPAAGRARSRYLAALTGADAQGIWEWGYLQMVSTALVLWQIGERALAQRMFSIAHAWCACTEI